MAGEELVDRAPPSKRASISREPEAYGATSSSRAAPPARAELVSPGAPALGLAASALRSSTTRQRSSSSGARVAKWTRTGVPSARGAATAAGSVAETLTTIRSPATSNSGSSSKRAWEIAPARGVGDQQPDAVAREPARLGRLDRLERARQLEGQRAHDATSRRPTSSRAR